MSDISFTCKYHSPLGEITLACRDDRLTGLWFDGQKHYRSTLTGRTEEADVPVLRLAVRWLDEYFSGHEPQFVPPLSLMGTPFSRLVWRRLMDIPCGTTLTYKELTLRMAAAGGALYGRRQTGVVRLLRFGRTEASCGAHCRVCCYMRRDYHEVKIQAEQ
jgi:methylated-DNA-[protein]-cysteine S-methyltransferase